MYFDKLNSEEQISYLIKPILSVFQKAGGQLERSEIRDRISEDDENIAKFEQTLYTSAQTGKPYKRFDFKFNFALKELKLVGFISYEQYKSSIKLTSKGAQLNIGTLDVEKDVRSVAHEYWEQRNAENRKKKQKGNLVALATGSDVGESIPDVESETEVLDDFKARLQDAIAKMSPAKFEQFSRALLTKMGVEFTEKGIQVSNDGGIDGYGYHMDDNDFRTTRVVIQCKRFNSNAVREPDINQFLGAMSKFQADYGVFITNSRFTKSAKEAAR